MSSLNGYYHMAGPVSGSPLILSPQITSKQMSDILTFYLQVI